MKRILLVKTSSLGDVVHCLPVVNDILAHHPNAHIDWVVEESFADIPRLHPQVNKVFTVAVRRWRKQFFSRKTWAEMAAFKQLIQKNQYDAIIDCQGLLKSALIAKQVHGEKHGYDKNSIREPLASCFYDKTYNISYNQHAVTRNRTLAAMSLGYRVPKTAPDYGLEKHKIRPKNSTSQNGCSERLAAQGFEACLKTLGVNGAYIIALHGTSRAAKLWPVENWVNLGKELATQNLNLALPWASEAELTRANQIASQLKNTTVLPKLSIAEIATVIANAKAAVGVDTGLSHLAVALSIPTIAIYTDTNPALTGVMAGAKAEAVNLGGIAQIPSVDDVMHALGKISA